MKQVIPMPGVSRTHGVKSANVHAKSLADELRGTIRGEVRFDKGSRALYATDGSNSRQVPIGVVLPRDGEDVIATVAACRGTGAPVLARGGGTSLAGQCCNVAVVLDLSKYMNSVLAIDPDNQLARVQPGTILDHLRTAAERSHLTFGPDPATHAQCSLGGMIGNNSCGVHSVMAGMTSDNIEELEILTYDGLRMRVGKTSDEQLARIINEGGRRGEMYTRLKSLRDTYADLIRQRFPKIPRRVSGYNLQQLLPENGFHVARALIGTEGTCVTVLEATARLVYSPPARSLLVLGYEEAVLKKLGLDFELLDSGCCGMAGIFGFEQAHYDVSIKCGERVLLPAVRNAAKETLIIADGFSCQEQIAQTTDRRALPLAQVIQMAMHEGSSEPGGEYPEAGYATQAAHQSLRSKLPMAVGMSAGLLLIGAAVMWMLRKRKTR